MVEKKEEFMLEMANFVLDVLTYTSEVIKRLAEVEEKYSNDYRELLEWKNNPLKIIEQLEKIEDDKVKALFVTRLFKIFLKLSIISDKLTNVFFVSSDEKKTISKELSNLANEIESCLTQAKEIKQ